MNTLKDIKRKLRKSWTSYRYSFENLRLQDSECKYKSGDVLISSQGSMKLYILGIQDERYKRALRYKQYVYKISYHKTPSYSSCHRFARSEVKNIDKHYKLNLSNTLKKL